MCKSECPNCFGTGTDGTRKLKDGNVIKKTCSICLGEGFVPDWDLERLSKLIAIRNPIQTELEI